MTQPQAPTLAPSELEAIRQRDAEVHYCATCHGRVYQSEIADPDAPHNITVDQCDAYLRRRVAATGKERLPDPKTGHLCWTPEDHHPFVEGPIPDYEDGAADRRFLLREVDRLLEAVRMAYEAIEGYWGTDLPDSEATAQRLWFARGDLDRLLDDYEPTPPDPSR